MGDEPDHEDVDDGDQPEIDDEEMADFGAVAEEIEAGSGAHEEDVQEDAADVDVDGRDDLPDPEDVGGRDVSVGTVYCNGLGMSAAVARARWGTADEDDREQLVEEYAGMAEELQIDEYVDQWMVEHGGMDQLGPGQAMLLSTMLWASLVAMDDPEMVENAAGEVPA